MSTTKAIIFDLDNTLLWDEKSIDEAFQAVCTFAADQTGAAPEQLETAVRDSASELFTSMEIYEWANMIEVTYLEALWGRFDSCGNPAFRKLQQLAPEYQTEAWYRGLLKTGTDDPELARTLALRFADERRRRPLIYDDTFAVLERLSGKFKLLLLTNGAPDLQQEKVDSIPGLADFFAHIVISGTFGAGKPAPAIFQHALKLLDVTAGEALMVGDNLDTDIRGANGVGMRNVWINHHRRTAPSGNRPSYEITRLTELLEIV
ncbi:HAD family hydrolase [Paenibacillus sp. H1-7]|uniref:HAD family hydrolase n=1 Tax=Paenibacillus sp. H1-7 TaxID=2282849 RepID=UPI001EF96FEB|nr:HAD family hydrolase [Paenibacillus sp. H1-7]ULL18216.1 HAD family hydrolase [Paenibacillus sp. H1-7]